MKRTCLPERVLIGTDECPFAGIFDDGSGEGGAGGLLSTAGVGRLSGVMNAGLSLSIPITDSFPCMLMVKCFVLRFITGNGPLYGGVSGGLTESFRTKTCVQLSKDG